MIHLAGGEKNSIRAASYDKKSLTLTGRVFLRIASTLRTRIPGPGTMGKRRGGPLESFTTIHVSSVILKSKNTFRKQINASKSDTNLLETSLHQVSARPRSAPASPGYHTRNSCGCTLVGAVDSIGFTFVDGVSRHVTSTSSHMARFVRDGVRDQGKAIVSLHIHELHATRVLNSARIFGCPAHK